VIPGALWADDRGKRGERRRERREMKRVS